MTVLGRIRLPNVGGYGKGRGNFAAVLQELACARPRASRKLRAMDCRAKILSPEALPAWRESLRAAGKRLVATNGCFDLLHAGHVSYLEAARNLGDALLVGVTGDAPLRVLKGPGRPLNVEADRALVIAALGAVDGVFVFQDDNANRFLSLARPNIYTKGGDYTVDTINQDERRFLDSLGTRIVILPVVAGRSTSALVEKIQRL